MKNGKWEEFFLFIRNFKMMLEASGTLADNATLQYLLTVLHGKAPRLIKKFVSSNWKNDCQTFKPGHI